MVNPPPVDNTPRQPVPLAVTAETQPGALLYENTEDCWTHVARYYYDPMSNHKLVMAQAIHQRTSHYQAFMMGVGVWNSLVEDKPAFPAMWTMAHSGVEEYDATCSGPPHTCNADQPSPEDLKWLAEPSAASTEGQDGD